MHPNEAPQGKQTRQVFQAAHAFRRKPNSLDSGPPFLMFCDIIADDIKQNLYCRSSVGWGKLLFFESERGLIAVEVVGR